MKIIVCPDSFKNCLTAFEAADAMAEGAAQFADEYGISSNLEIVMLPVADGGEGTAEILGRATGADRMEAIVTGPLGNQVRAAWYYLPEQQSVFIDLASASGLALAKPCPDVMNATTYGTGELIQKAIESAADTGRRLNVYIGAGGSATNDAGTGALQALGIRFFNEDLSIFTKPITGADLLRITDIDSRRLLCAGLFTKFHILADVEAPFCGNGGAVDIFAAQKGAGTEERITLEKGMRNLATVLKAKGLADQTKMKGAGAAGGFAGGMAAFLGAEIINGIDMVLDITDFDKLLEGADIVLTGEGKSDSQTLMNKAPFGVMRRAAAKGVATALFAGKIPNPSELYAAGFCGVCDINSPFPDCAPEEAMRPATARKRLTASVRDFLCRFYAENR